jgi:hypothetical protein
MGTWYDWVMEQTVLDKGEGKTVEIWDDHLCNFCGEFDLKAVYITTGNEWKDISLCLTCFHDIVVAVNRSVSAPVA